MWLAIIALADKVFNVIGILTGWIVKRSDESKIAYDKAQKEMDDAKDKGDFETWKSARSKRDNA